MKILLLDIPLFREELRQLGHEVCSLGPDPACDTVIPPGQWTLESIRASRPAGFEPDIVLQSESLKQRHFPLELARLPWPSVWYSIDGHLHLDWHLQMGRLVDRVLCSQLDVCRAFRGRGLRADWLPWSVNAPAELPAGRDLPLAMVGSFHPGHRPRRMQLLEKLKRRFPLELFGPPYTPFLSAPEQEEIYGRSRIVFNESIGGEINFRLLEAAACGACVLSDEADNGQDMLLAPGSEYIPWTTASLEERVEELLEDPERCLEVGHRARKRVLAEHGRLSRARQLVQLVQGTDIRPGRVEVDHGPVEDGVRRRLQANGLGPGEFGGSRQVPDCRSEEDLLPCLEWLRAGGEASRLQGAHPVLDLAIHADRLLQDLKARALGVDEAKAAAFLLCEAFVSAGRRRTPGMWNGPSGELRYPAWELQLIEAMAHVMPGDPDLIVAHARCLVQSGQPEAALDSLTLLLKHILSREQRVSAAFLHEVAGLQEQCGFREQALLTLLALPPEELLQRATSPLAKRALLLAGSTWEELEALCSRQPDSAALERLLQQARTDTQRQRAEDALQRALAFAPNCSRIRRLAAQWKSQPVPERVRSTATGGKVL